jgi:hypothetical protein
MKTNLLTNLITGAFGFAVLTGVGFAENDSTLSPAKVVATSTITTAAPGSATTGQVAVPANPDVISPEWTKIENTTYDTRDQFFIGLRQLEATVDRQVGELTAKHAAMKPMAKTIDYTDWDLAMKEMKAARAYLKAMDEEASKATPETWEQEKEKVHQAWVRTQEACEKVKLSMTT